MANTVIWKIINFPYSTFYLWRRKCSDIFPSFFSFYQLLYDFIWGESFIFIFNWKKRKILFCRYWTSVPYLSRHCYFFITFPHTNRKQVPNTWNYIVQSLLQWFINIWTFYNVITMFFSAAFHCHKAKFDKKYDTYSDWEPIMCQVHTIFTNILKFNLFCISMKKILLFFIYR